MTIAAGATDSRTECADRVGNAALEILARTARQVALYGLDHPIATEALAKASLALEEAAGGEMLDLRADRDGLLWNGVPVTGSEGGARRFHAAMRDRLIAAIEIDAKVRPEDLARLLFVMAQDAEELGRQGGAGKGFGSVSSSTVRISEVDFAADMLVPESTWRHLRTALDPDCSGNLSRLISSCAGSLPGDGAAAATVMPAAELDRENESAEELVAAGIARLVQRAGENLYFGDQGAWADWRNEVARQLESLDARWRSLIFRAPAGVSSEYPDMLALIATELTPAACASLVLDHAGSIRAERSEALRLAIERILTDRDRRREIEAALRDRALAQGVSEPVYESVIGLLISRITPKQGTELPAPSLQPTLSRSDVSRPRQDISDLLTTTDPEAVRRSRLCVLLEALDTYLTITQYGTVISSLTRATEECTDHDDLEGLIAAVSALSRETADEGGREPSRRAVVASALARAGTDRVVACLTAGLEGASRERLDQIVSLLGVLGEPGMQALSQLLRTGDELRVDLAMASLLQRDSPDFSHLRDVISQTRGISREHILRALVRSRDERLAEKAAAATADMDEQARLQMIQLILEAGRRDLSVLIVPMLADPSGAVRLAAIGAVAELGFQQAAPDLCALVQSEASFGEGARVKEAAARALGVLRAPGAVRVLCGALRGSSLLHRLTGHKLRTVAAEALGLVGGQEAREALERGRRSRHPAVREACRRALVRLIADERSEAGARNVG